MVNLLFISSNPKIEAIKTALQPLLRLKIDIVGDFDYGLKDVFEKRPAIVFIQDQIAGVTGESVARHIQMLLGSGAPTFILMYDGNLKGKLIKGLYEYLVDLSQSDTKVLASIQSALESVLGQQWQKIYVAPPVNKSVEKNAWSVPAEQVHVADDMGDDLVSGLGTVTHNFNIKSSFPDIDISEPEEPFQVVSSPHDQLSEILAVTSSQQKRTENDAVEAACGSQESGTVSLPDKSVATATDATSAALSSPRGVPELSLSLSGANAELMLGSESVPVEKNTENVIEKMPVTSRNIQLVCRLLNVSIALLILCVAGGYWYLAKQKSHSPGLLVKPSSSAAVSTSAHKSMSVSTSVVQRPLSAAQKNATYTLPSFIPLAGHDRAFASQKPGWERYVGSDAEFRVYRLAGKLKAVQVLAIKGKVLSKERLSAILLELTGTADYKITSNEHKGGVTASRGTVGSKAELLIYRKKSTLQAFVISLD